MTNESSLPTNVGSNDGLGLDPKHAQFEKTMRHWCPEHWTFESDGYGGYHNHATELAWIAWQGATGTEKERCVNACTTVMDARGGDPAGRLLSSERVRMQHQLQAAGAAQCIAAIEA